MKDTQRQCDLRWLWSRGSHQELWCIGSTSWQLKTMNQRCSTEYFILFCLLSCKNPHSYQHVILLKSLSCLSIFLCGTGCYSSLLFAIYTSSWRFFDNNSSLRFGRLLLIVNCQQLRAPQFHQGLQNIIYISAFPDYKAIPVMKISIHHTT